MSAACALCAVALLALFWLRTYASQPEADIPPVVASAPAEALTASDAAPVVAVVDDQSRPSDVVDADAGGALATGAALVVDIRALDTLWLEAVADGEPHVYRLLASGEHERVEASDTIVLRVGDAAALEYTINGRAGQSLGGPHQVRVARITRDNYQTFADDGASGR
jgi:hypothetical protein